MGRPAKYPDEFRREAVELVKSSGRPVAEVARSLSIAEGTLWNWVKGLPRLGVTGWFRRRLPSEGS